LKTTRFHIFSLTFDIENKKMVRL